MDIEYRQEAPMRAVVTSHAMVWLLKNSRNNMFVETDSFFHLEKGSVISQNNFHSAPDGEVLYFRIYSGPFDDMVAASNPAFKLGTS